MRPAGVRQRVRDLLDREWDLVHSWSERALRVHVTSFANLCARQWHHDHPMTTVLRRYREVIALLGDPQHLRTGSDFETRSLACVEHLRPLIGDLAERAAAEVSFEQQERAREPLLWIPPLAILGEASPGWPSKAAGPAEVCDERHSRRYLADESAVRRLFPPGMGIAGERQWATVKRFRR